MTTNRLAGRPRPPRFRPWLEELERRTLLSGSSDTTALVWNISTITGQQNP
jgi:hypothetical protein